jgi:hypothetical protein
MANTDKEYTTGIICCTMPGLTGLACTQNPVEKNSELKK